MAQIVGRAGDTVLYIEGKISVRSQGAKVLARLALVAATSVAESLTEPFLSYQTAFREAHGEMGIFKAHKHALSEAFPEVISADEESLAVDTIMSMIGDAIAGKVCDKVDEQKDPEFILLPRAAIEEAVGFAVGEAVGEVLRGWH